jgi:heparanase 1
MKSEIWRFTDVKTMDELAKTVDTALSETKAVTPTLNVWLSETSSTYGGGTPNVSDRFVAGFL